MNAELHDLCLVAVRKAVDTCNRFNAKSMHNTFGLTTVCQCFKELGIIKRNGSSEFHYPTVIWEVDQILKSLPEVEPVDGQGIQWRLK